ncbi:MAG: endonuclease III [Candidatus Abyssobacteria bacterium SURF_5]|uniref:Endonuclease III n=1 Tax=Abyssobacteria bacterium (strain SURF_5) TaxID=2093360 RepID=A0A3A4P020_ABYX5|nr:MAG: endonuclease III [Candidatus Abyssubacteria bacterium SURF_5]
MSPIESLNEKKKRARKIFSLLRKEYPDARPELEYSNPLELLVATILSAQCTDERVNQVTRILFKKYRSPQDYVRVPDEELEREIRSTGFFRSKTKSIKGSCRMLIEKFRGEVPRTMDEILELPGVARKTGNIVLSHAYGVIAGIAVDTHVKRLSQRLGLTEHTEPGKIEIDLCALLPKKDWPMFSDVLIFHGRRVCYARKPAHDRCVVRDLCPSRDI